jgi:glycopeptide antibiotics resistance protein
MKDTNQGSYLIIVTSKRRKEKTMTFSKLLKILLWVIFFIYSLVLIKYLILDRMHYSGFSARVYNVYPLNSIKQYIINKDHYNFNTWAMNLFGNLFMLFPFGVLSPLLFKKMKKTHLFLMTLLTFNFAIEALQYITMLGSFDIDDLIMNSSGAVIGYIVTRVVLLLNIFEKGDKNNEITV